MSGRATTAGQGQGPGQGQDPLRAELESWIQSAQEGDPHALGLALQSFRAYLRLMASRGLGSDLAAKGDASDLIQETFLRAHRRFGDYRGRSPEEWRGWLRSILINSLAEHRRRYGVVASRRVAGEVALDPQEWSIASNEETPSRAMMRSERAEAVLAAMERLPAEYREVILERHRDRLTHEQVGRTRGISADAARKLWERAIGRLRQELGPAEDWR